MQSLPSFITDTTDLTQKINYLRFKSENSFLVTLDVNILYTNIPHADGMDACKYFITDLIQKCTHSSDSACS